MKVLLNKVIYTLKKLIYEWKYDSTVSYELYLILQDKQDSKSYSEAINDLRKFHSSAFYSKALGRYITVSRTDGCGIKVKVQ